MTCTPNAPNVLKKGLQQGYAVLRSRSTWMACALVIAAVCVVREIVVQGPQRTDADVSCDVNTPVHAPASDSVSLPVAEQRQHYDHIIRDFFVSSSGRGSDLPTPQTTAGSLHMADKDLITDDGVQQVSTHLHLKAIIQGPQPRAFVNEGFVRLGEQIHVDGFPEMVFEVYAIKDDRVLLTCGSTKVVLKLIPDAVND